MKTNKLILLTTLAVLSLGTFTTVSNATANAQTIKFTLVKTKKDNKKTNKKAKKLTKFDKEELKWRKQLAKGDNNGNTSSNRSNTQTTDVIKDGYNYTTNEITDYNTYQSIFLKTALNDINSYRTSHDLNALSVDDTLTTIANQRAKQGYDYRNDSWYDGHHDQNGNFIAANMAHQMGINYTTFGENSGNGTISGNDGVLEGPTESANATINEWINEGPSGSHYQNMMNPNFHKIGLGLYEGPNQGEYTDGGYAEDYSN